MSKREKDYYSSFMHTQMHTYLCVYNGFCFIVFWPSVMLLIKWIFTNSTAYIHIYATNKPSWMNNSWTTEHKWKHMAWKKGIQNCHQLYTVTTYFLYQAHRPTAHCQNVLTSSNYSLWNYNCALTGSKIDDYKGLLPRLQTLSTAHRCALGHH